ncbi:ferric iron uptake transcriptional regulator [Noviherbaspirillum malthae]|jgi:Fur family ferric uptake transcriptional regulator|uniref:ferric iron uptake transcriptional regulator n=1 Tax=Noviherbaspirillum malthae TaxID=1260987 RepID=UPI00188DEBF9|nr:ferric iron uptake transcriptional regulator [Noviherbaspirillum malthae]
MDIPSELHNSGLKATLPRLRILQIFHDVEIKHLSAEAIYRILLNEKIDVGLATVYRVLMQFAQAGLLVRHHFESGAALFELNSGRHHDHLVCTICGKVEEFVDDEIEHRQKQIAKDMGFVLQEHSMSLYGACSQCGQSRLDALRRR